MVLKDLFCSRCGSVRSEMVPGDVTDIILSCANCGMDAVYRSHCTGGVRLKPYVTLASYAGRDWSGDIEFLGYRAESEDGKAEMDRRGKAIHGREKFSRDAREETRARRRHKRQIERGQRKKIYFL